MSTNSSLSEFTLANESEEKYDELGDVTAPSMSISQSSSWVLPSPAEATVNLEGNEACDSTFVVDHTANPKLENELQTLLEDLPTPSASMSETFEFQDMPEPDGSSSLCLDQEFISSLEWKEQSRHIFVLSEAGKPIYSRHGNEDKLVTLFGLLQALVSVVQDGNDLIRSIHVGPTNIVFLVKSPLILVCVSRISQCVGQIQNQLMYFYNQVVSILTAKQLNKIYEKRRNYDLRRLLAGSERLLTNLANLLDNDPSFMLGAIKCLPLPNSTREVINQTIVQYTSKLKNVVFAVLIANNQLVTLVRMKKCFMHPMDLHLILNLIDSSESFKAAESWTPLCLPRFDSSGFVHAHVSYLADDCQACLVILTVDRDSFFILSEAKQRIVERLRKYSCLDAINTAMSNVFPTMSYIGVPEVRHFLYKLKSLAQFTAPALDIPYINVEQGREEIHGRSSSPELARLYAMYFKMHSRLHSHSRPLKLIYWIGDTEDWLAWVTSTFELYVTFEPLVKKSLAINAVNKLLKWVKKEEDQIFIINSPTF